MYGAISCAAGKLQGAEFHGGHAVCRMILAKQTPLCACLTLPVLHHHHPFNPVPPPQALCKDMEVLGAQRTQLEEQLAQLAAAGGGPGAAQQLEEVSQQLAAVAATLEDKELRWLELAELAGDL